MLMGDGDSFQRDVAVGTNGSILILVLVFLFLLTTLATNLLSTAATQLQLSTNFHDREARMASAASIAEALAVDPANFDVGLAAGTARCLPSDSAPLCKGEPLDVGNALDSLPAQTELFVRITREVPEVLNGTHMRERESRASSAIGEKYSAFSVLVAVTGGSGSSGGVEIVKGVGVRLPPVDSIEQHEF